VRLLALLLLFSALGSLAAALFFLLRRPGSDGLLTALTWRIALSVLLFLLLLAAWYAGLIEPHGIGGARQSQ
jgi:hypothetical protein